MFLSCYRFLQYVAEYKSLFLFIYDTMYEKKGTKYTWTWKRDLFCEENLVVHVYMYLYACGRMSKAAFCPVKKHLVTGLKKTRVAPFTVRACNMGLNNAPYKNVPDSLA